MRILIASVTMLLMMLPALYVSNIASATSPVGVYLLEGDMDEDAVREAFVQIYKASRSEFKSIRSGEKKTMEGGGDYYDSSVEVSGAVRSIITVDEEGSYSFHSEFYPGGSLEAAEQMVTTLSTIISENVPDKGFTVSKGTDAKYHNYRKTTIEFESDNISEMGKYPSVAIGIKKDGDNFTVELVINEPFWK